MVSNDYIRITFGPYFQIEYDLAGRTSWTPRSSYEYNNS